MNGKLKKIWDWLKRHKGGLLALVYVCTAIFIAAALTLVIIANDSPVLEILSYLSYGLAAISLAYTVYTIVIYAPMMKQGVVQCMRRSNFLSKLLDN